MKKTTLLLGMVLFILVSTAQAQSCYQGGCDGAIINVTANGKSDDTECIGKGYDGAAFHCCGYINCCVPEDEACENETWSGCTSQCPEGGGCSFCQVLPTLNGTVEGGEDGGDYACCNCYGSEVGRCSDGYDNDCDGLTDINDTDCQGTTTTTTIPCPCYAPCGDGCVYYTEYECEPQTFTCDQGCVCDTGDSFDDRLGDYRITAEGTCKPEIPSPEFSSLAILLTALLTAPAFAYLIIKKRH